MTNYNILWTEDNIQKLQKLYLEGMSYMDIAILFGQGFTRNSVAGAVHRYLEKRPRSRKDKIEPSIDTKQHGVLSINFKKKHKTMPKESYVNHGLTNWPPESGRCLAIIGEVVAMKACGLKCAKGRVYCPDHCDVYYVKKEQRIIQN